MQWFHRRSTKCGRGRGRGRRRRTNSARISHPPPFRRVTKNQRILFLVDNMSVVYVINKQSSKDKIILNLLRRLVLNCLKYNIVFRAKHVPGIENNLADNLSRCKFQAARLLRPTLQTNQSSILRHQLPWYWNT